MTFESLYKKEILGDFQSPVKNKKNEIYHICINNVMNTTIIIYEFFSGYLPIYFV